VEDKNGHSKNYPNFLVVLDTCFGYEGIHGIKGFVIPTKSFVKIGIKKIFCYNKMFSSINKTFGCCSKIFGCSNKKKYLLSLTCKSGKTGDERKICLLLKMNQELNLKKKGFVESSPLIW